MHFGISSAEASCRDVEKTRTWRRILRTALLLAVAISKNQRTSPDSFLNSMLENAYAFFRRIDRKCGLMQNDNRDPGLQRVHTSSSPPVVVSHHADVVGEWSGRLMAKSKNTRYRYFAALTWFALLSVTSTVAIFVYWPRSAEKPSSNEEHPTQLKHELLLHDPGASDHYAADPRILQGHGRLVGVVATSADGARLLSADSSDLIRIWDRHTGVPLVKIDAAGLGLRRAMFSRNSLYVLACGKDPAIRMWNTKSGEADREFRGHADTVSALRCVPGANHFISSSFDGSLVLWDVETGQMIRQFATTGML